MALPIREIHAVDLRNYWVMTISEQGNITHQSTATTCKWRNSFSSLVEESQDKDRSCAVMEMIKSDAGNNIENMHFFFNLGILQSNLDVVY